MFCDVRLPDVVHVARPNSNENRVRRERIKGIELGELRKCFQRKVICNGIIPAFAGAVIAASQYICVGGARDGHRGLLPMQRIYHLSF
jgi:hypothetical protein